MLGSGTCFWYGSPKVSAQSIGGSFGSSPWRELNWFIFLLRLVGRNFGPQMIQASALCPIIPQHSQNILLSREESYNNCLGRCCIIIDGRWRAEIMIALAWSGKCCWRYNHLYINIDSMNVSSCVYSIFYVFSKECDEICHIGRNEISEFILLWQCLHVLE